MNPLVWCSAVGVLGAVLWIMALTSLYGPGLSPDSTEYLYLAAEILSGGLRFWNENEAVSQPPFYPAMIAALAGSTGVDVMKAALWLNLLAAGALIALVARGVVESGRSVLVLSVALAFVILSAPFSEVFSMAWSEIVFLPLVYGAMWAAAAPERGWLRASVVPGVLGALAVMTRYAGVALVPVLCLHLLVTVRGGWRRRLAYAVTAGAIPTGVFLAYLWRNLTVSGSTLGVRHSSQTTLGENLRLTAEVFGGWVFWPALALGLWIFRRRLGSWVRELTPMLRLWVAYAGAHLAFLVWTSTTTAFDPIDTRLLSPVLPALVAAFAALAQGTPEGPGRARRLLGVAWVSLLLLVPVRSAHGLYRHHTTEGAGGYHTRAWFESELMNRLRTGGIPATERVFTNLPDGLYILTGIRSELSPASRGYRSDERTGVDARNLGQRYPGFEGSLWVWFDSTGRDFLLTPEQIREWCRLERVEAFDDGVIYRVGACPGDPG